MTREFHIAHDKISVEAGQRV